MGWLGLIVLMLLAWMMSTARHKIAWRVVITGLGLQFLLALVILKTDAGASFFEWTKDLVTAIISLSDEGAQFMFGSSFTDHFFAFKVLPTIIFASAISYVLFYLGFLQMVVSGLAKIMHKVMGISGSESLVVAANVFLGQTEAPLFVSPYIRSMTRSEINTMMTSGMATVAGGVLAAYVGFGVSAGHLLAASLMSAPAAVVIAKLMYPEQETSPTMATLKLEIKAEETNIFEAACKGASDGLKLALNVGAMLIAFIALVAMVNMGIGYVSGLFGYDLSLEVIFGWVFRPIAWLIGIPWHEAGYVGQLLGTKIVINEFLAFAQLKEFMDGSRGVTLSEHSQIITTYALCGFANFASIAIQIGGIGALVPERKRDFAKHGLRSMIGGTFAALMTACIAGLLL